MQSSCFWVITFVGTMTKNFDLFFLSELIFFSPKSKPDMAFINNA